MKDGKRERNGKIWHSGRGTGSSLFLCNSLLLVFTQEKKVSQQCLQRAQALRMLRCCELMAFGGCTLFPSRYNRGLFGVAAATKTMGVGVFEQQWERLSSVAVEGRRRRKEG